MDDSGAGTPAGVGSHACLGCSPRADALPPRSRRERHLRDVGYETSFFFATDDPEFDASAAWLTRAGFADVRFAPARTEASDPTMWGAGLQDDVFYERSIRSLERKVARDPGRPQFAVLASASNHYPFDRNPRHVPDPRGKSKYQRNYTASLSASDAWLRTFFDELRRRRAFRDARDPGGRP